MRSLLYENQERPSTFEVGRKASTSERVTNLGLRSLTLASRFLLLFLLARLLEPAEVGLYGLIAATLGYSLYLVGFDFYIYTTREVISHDASHWGALLKNQSVLTAILYLIFVPLLTLLFWFNVIPWYVGPWFFLLLVLEHLNQELARLLIAISRPLTASVMLFTRSGVWIVFLALLMITLPEQRTILTVLQFWSLGGIAAAALGIWSLTRMNVGGWGQSIDWNWIMQGLRIAMPFLIATLALRAIYTLDRYWFESLVSIDALAAYVLFIGIAGTMTSFLDSGVVVFHYPAMIRSWQQQQREVFIRETHRLLTQTVLFSLVFALIALSVMPHLLDWLNRPIYHEYAHLFHYFLLATALFALSNVPHYTLYAQGRDRSIIFSHIAGLICFVAVTWTATRWTITEAVPLGLCAAFGLILVWKSLAYLLLTPRDYRISGVVIQ